MGMLIYMSVANCVRLARVQFSILDEPINHIWMKRGTVPVVRPFIVHSATYFYSDEDPVEALRKFAEKAESEPIFVSQAYKKTQPQPILDYAPEVI